MIYTSENIGLRVIPEYYKIKITNEFTNIDEVIDGKLNLKNGFIDALKTQEYVDFPGEDVLETEETSKEKFIFKSLGYIRWLNLCLQLSRFGVCFMEVDKLEGATFIKTPTAIEFTMGYEQPNSIYIKYKEDDTDVELKGVDALKYIIKECLSSNYTSFVQVFDPTKDSFGRNPSLTTRGFFDKLLTSEKLYDTIELIPDSIITIEGPFTSPDGDTGIEF